MGTPDFRDPSVAGGVQGVAGLPASGSICPYGDVNTFHAFKEMRYALKNAHLCLKRIAIRRRESCLGIQSESHRRP